MPNAHASPSLELDPLHLYLLDQNPGDATGPVTDSLYKSQRDVSVAIYKRIQTNNCGRVIGLLYLKTT